MLDRGAADDIKKLMVNHRAAQLEKRHGVYWLPCTRRKGSEADAVSPLCSTRTEAKTEIVQELPTDTGESSLGAAGRPTPRQPAEQEEPAPAKQLVTEKELSKFKVVELKKMLKQRGAKQDGLKAVLVSRLCELMNAE